MDHKIKANSSCHEELCDTCSGDSDDVLSVCSWTTDQGDFEYHMADHAASPNTSGLSWGADTQSPPGCMSVTMVPVPMICYVAAPTPENAISWPDASGISSDPWPRDSQLFQGQASALGTWNQRDVPQSSHRHSPASSRLAWRKHGIANDVGRMWRQSSHRSKAKTCSVSPSCAQNQGACNEGATTVILRNLPKGCDRDMLLRILDYEGFSGGYDFLHMPIDFQTRASLGYAIMNLVSHDVALSIHKHFEGFSKWPFCSDNVCEVAWNSPHQGLMTHIDRYRNSPLMHPSVPETYRPVLFEHGIRVEFPAPTSRIRPPRIRHQKPGTSIIL